ncbi:MAG: AMP-binding protein [Pseudonocardiaceae bacterium]|nr:AMP-binding protein [Pseudonocardiaceae bacterium]
MSPRNDPNTIPAAVREAADRFGEDEALVDGTVRLSYRELLEQVRLVARALLTEGIQRGDRVAIYSPNTHHWMLAALGASYAGATLVPINTRFTGPEALDILTRSQARALVVAGEFLGTDRLTELRAAGTAESLRTVIRVPVAGPTPDEDGVLRWEELPELAAETPARQADVRAEETGKDDASDILFTSGTTGRSKGAISAHRQSLGVAAAWADCGRLTAEDRYLVINPFFHNFGYKAGILASLLRGTTVVPQAVFDVDTAMHVVDAERITVLPGPPTIYQSMLDHPGRAELDLSSLRLAVTGAATVPVALVERMQRELSFSCVLTAYGLTEAVVATMCRPEDSAETVAHTCGRAAADFEVRIEEEGGEILLRGPHVMLGYLDDPDATKQAIDADGWLHTGDIGRLDERGYLTITDRLKDMYICGGFNVYPAEVEQTLARLSGVAESAVVGVPDDRLGEVGKAYIVPSPGGAPSTSEVVTYCRERLANYKVPRHVEVREQLPRNPSGKVLKRVLREESIGDN